MPEVLKLVKSNCRDCHKCIRFCPVKAIRFTGHQAHIINDECILCGSCYVVCPHQAKEIEDARETVKVMLQSMEPVVASLAPSFVAGFDGAGIGAMRDALKKLGFADAEETAIGATLVKREYEKQLNEGKRDIIITSCCPAVNTLIEKHYPELCRYISPVVTPMVAHAMDIKRRRPDVKVVFIGPCIAKKDEAYGTPVDAVLTFTELKKMFSDAGIEVAHETDADPQTRARLFPTVGGILRTMDLPDNGYTYITVDGARECRAALDDIAAGEIHRCFIEMSSCEGSCIGGPVMEKYDNFPSATIRWR
jgi:iron only hydrogenase large subunit-like protein